MSKTDDISLPAFSHACVISLHLPMIIKFHQVVVRIVAMMSPTETIRADMAVARITNFAVER